MNSQRERKQCFPFNNGFVYIKYGCSEKMVNVAVGVDEREDIFAALSLFSIQLNRKCEFLRS
jgi:hypothetical protein